MDAFDCIATKLDIREFKSENVPADVKLKILEAGRLTGSGMNVQSWRFILVQGPDRLRKLAEDSTTGIWVEGTNFAVIVVTEPKYGFHLIDAGRALQDMQLTAWNFGVASCIFTGINQEAIRKDFGIPKEMTASVVVGFGYPAKRITGKRKSRKPLSDLVYQDRFGNPLDLR